MQTKVIDQNGMEIWVEVLEGTGAHPTVVQDGNETLVRSINGKFYKA